ncbi:hypothetical protein C3747_28g343 [Trypanosoma cruzi]|uniref:Uncharacterized protein n=2 Tax=Trypanosoma cruzi TaxID=5693 RepID=Q4DGQ4_TRYCC|nr:hypothetical protein, conserved [Trypanosoma cruzi]EAN91691.1 hypothetical protein, conserved [Trypanosoma cruzi]PWV15550.1 hypothetical protein C3747_28g343 [Trypanosoma cruzi]RNC37611.1 hypothetical protein TcCL_NonESM13217 [Trypanosoma cruzi]|eukprot:XP_813542.1 hypothetical protein [Trypanosoma cruzi strain CL Brener]
MEAIKGLARRTTQSIREKVKNREATGHDELLEVTSKKVLQYQKSGEVICSKLIRAAGLIEELGRLLKDVGEEYQSISDLPQESSQLATDVLDMGTKLVATAQEHQKGLKEEGFDVLNAFIKNTSKLRDAEEARRKNRLEYDFFRQKVLDLRSCPPKDTSRIPRNEQKMENWRVEFWRATENHKAVCSQLYVEGQRAIDLSVLTLTKVLGSFMNIAGDGFKQQFVNARLPVYPTAPILPPAPLPPNPMPAFQPLYNAGGHTTVTYGQLQQQLPWPQDLPPQSQERQGWQEGYPSGWSQQWQQQQQEQQQQQPSSVESHISQHQHSWGQLPPQLQPVFEKWQTPEQQQQQQQQQGRNLSQQNTSSVVGLHASSNNYRSSDFAYTKPSEGNGNGIHLLNSPQTSASSLAEGK